MPISFEKNSDNKVIMDRDNNIYVLTPDINALKRLNSFPDHIILYDILLGKFKFHWEDVTSPLASSRDELFDLLVSGIFGSGSPVIFAITGNNVGGEVGKSASEVVRFTVNKNITNFTGAESNNPNVIINSVTKVTDTTVDVDLNTSGAAWEEAFSIKVTGDGETTPYYAMAVEAALVISSMESELVPYNVSAGLPKIYLNKNILVLTSVESDNPNVVLDDGFPVVFDNIIDGILVDTTAATEGETFNIRVVADGETTDYYAMSVDYSYIEFDEVGSAANAVSGYSEITGWNKITYPVLWFAFSKPGEYRLHAFTNKTDRDALTNEIFYVDQYINNVIEQNSSGFGGVLNVDMPISGTDKIWVHAKAFIYTETNEVGDPATECGGYEDITGWDRLVDTALYFHIYDDAGTKKIEIYDNITSRNARTSGDILAIVIEGTGDRTVTEQNSSGFGGTMLFATGSSDGDKMYVTAS